MEHQIEKNKQKKRKRKLSRNQKSELTEARSTATRDLISSTVQQQKIDNHPVSPHEKLKSLSSWNEAFAAAASVKPVELDEDFIRRTDGSGTFNHEHDDDAEIPNHNDLIGARKVSQLASEFFQTKSTIQGQDDAIIPPSSCLVPQALHHEHDDTKTRTKKEKKRKKKKKQKLDTDPQDPYKSDESASNIGTLHLFLRMTETTVC